MRAFPTAVTVLAASAMLCFVTGCQAGSTNPQSTPNVDMQLMMPESLTYQQYQSTPDFDSGQYLIEGDIDLMAFSELLAENDLVEEDYESPVEPGGAMDGALTSTVTVTWPTGTTNVISVVDRNNPSEFEQELSDMVTEWNESDLGEAITVP